MRLALFVSSIIWVSLVLFAQAPPPLPLVPSGKFTITMDYPTNELREDLTFRVYHSTNLLAAKAAPPLVQPVNGNFEEGTNGWRLSGSVRIAEGSKEGRGLSFNAGDTEPTGLASVLATTLPGQLYDLSFDIGIVSYNTNEQRLLVSLESGLLVSRLITLMGVPTGASVWTNQVIEFRAGSIVTLISFNDRSPTTSAVDMWVDNVKFVPKGNDASSSWRLLSTHVGTNPVLNVRVPVDSSPHFLLLTSSNINGEQTFTNIPNPANPALSTIPPIPRGNSTLRIEAEKPTRP